MLVVVAHGRTLAAQTKATAHSIHEPPQLQRAKSQRDIPAGVCHGGGDGQSDDGEHRKQLQPPQATAGLPQPIAPPHIPARTPLLAALKIQHGGHLLLWACWARRTPGQTPGCRC